MISNRADSVVIPDSDMFRVESFYRACLHCGMRRTFDLQTWTLQGQFYMPKLERRAQLTKSPEHDH
jgi:hypothetical protein